MNQRRLFIVVLVSICGIFVYFRQNQRTQSTVESGKLQESTDVPHTSASAQPSLRFAPSLEGVQHAKTQSQDKGSKPDFEATVSLKDLLSINPEKKPATMIPYLQDGVSAIQFSEIVPGGIFDKMGLQSGDVVYGCGATPPDQPFRALKQAEKQPNQPVNLHFCVFRQESRYVFDITANPETNSP